MIEAREKSVKDRLLRINNVAGLVCRGQARSVEALGRSFGVVDAGDDVLGQQCF